MAKERVERDEEDLVRLYLTDIGQYPLLTKDDEVRLAQTIEGGRDAELELATKVLALTGSNGAIQERPLPSDDPVRRKPDISRARELLGWEPAVPLDEGLERTVEYFRHALAD